MKNLILIMMLSIMLSLSIKAQDYTNFISCKVDGKEWKAEAKRMKIPAFGFEYLAVAAFQVSPDVQVWIRMYYFKDQIKPGTYPVISEVALEKSSKKKKPEENPVWVLIDYTEETKGLGHAFHDGESLSGTLIIEEVGDKFIKGSFEADLTGVYYKKRTMATVTGSGIRATSKKNCLPKPAVACWQTEDRTTTTTPKNKTKPTPSSSPKAVSSSIGAKPKKKRKNGRKGIAPCFGHAKPLADFKKPDGFFNGIFAAQK